MNCQASIPGPRGDRDPWPDDSDAEPPTRAVRIRTVLLLVAAYFFAVGALAVVGGAFLQWWRGS